MNAIERLKRDHAILRSKFDVLEAGLRMGPETWHVLREVCFTLSRQLQNHMKREEDLIMACRSVMTPSALADLAVEHRDEREHLRTINRLFVGEHSHTLERIRPSLTAVIQGLRRHMQEEERELFPILERELGERAPARAEAREPAGLGLDGCMTVNSVLHRYPQARAVLEGLFINVPSEGYDCLDEVAWRRGMDVQDLLDRLEHAVLAGQPPGREALREAQSCGCQ